MHTWPCLVLRHGPKSHFWRCPDQRPKIFKISAPDSPPRGANQHQQGRFGAFASAKPNRRASRMQAGALSRGRSSVSQSRKKGGRPSGGFGAGLANRSSKRRPAPARRSNCTFLATNSVRQRRLLPPPSWSYWSTCRRLALLAWRGRHLMPQWRLSRLPEGGPLPV